MASKKRRTILNRLQKNIVKYQGKFSALENGSSFQVRYVPAPIAIRLAIYDRKKVNLSVTRTMDEMLPCLWSNNSVLAKIVMAYFEELWETSDLLSDKNKSA